MNINIIHTLCHMLDAIKVKLPPLVNEDSCGVPMLALKISVLTLCLLVEYCMAAHQAKSSRKTKLCPIIPSKTLVTHLQNPFPLQRVQRV